MLEPLKEAYKEIQAQTQLRFDIEKEVLYELQLILAQAKQAPFETINQLMVDLYREVFNSDEVGIYKGAMLRTFLYKYKLSLMKNGNAFSDEDMVLLLSIAKASEKELNNLCNAK